MRIRSHLDPTLFVIFVHVNASAYDAAFQALARRLKSARGTDLEPIFAALRDREQRVIAHERYHFWQGLRLPFVHLYAATTYRLALMTLKKLANIDADWRAWPGLAMVPVFDRLDMTFVMSSDGAGRAWFGDAPQPGATMALAYSAKEMLECAATLYDYHVACPDRAQLSDPQKFRRWRQRNPGYTRIFEFLAAFLRSERLALRVALPLINAAFCTSRPERAFFELAARVWGVFVKATPESDGFLAQPEPVRWPELFRGWVREAPFDLPLGETPETVELMDDLYYHLDPEQWLGLTYAGGMRHPFLGPLAVEWRMQAKVVPGLEYYLDLPGYVANDEAHDFAFAADPKLRLIQVFLEDGATRTFPIGDGMVKPAFVDPVFDHFTDADYRGFIIDQMAAYGAFRRATGSQLTEAARTCGHLACPHFMDNFCNCYPTIPEDFADCGFPGRLKQWIANNRD